jgi:hypothetical protein
MADTLCTNLFTLFRMTAAEALKHKWIQMQVVGADAIERRIAVAVPRVSEENMSVIQQLPFESAIMCQSTGKISKPQSLRQ